MHKDELYHYGVKGMKWGVRKDRKKSSRERPAPLPVYSRKNEPSVLHQNPSSSTAKFLGRFFPKIAENQKRYKDYTIRSKDGKTIGNLSTYDEGGGSLNIMWLGINSKAEGKGYGQSAMRIAIDEARNQGYRQMTLEVPTTSPNARHIYEKYGFRDTGEKMFGDEDDIWGGLTKMRLDLTEIDKKR